MAFCQAEESKLEEKKSFLSEEQLLPLSFIKETMGLVVGNAVVTQLRRTESTQLAREHNLLV